LDSKSAKAWLTNQIGKKAYDVIWDPLLRVKFGDHHDRISAAWIWHRIHRVTTSRRKLLQKDFFGYLEGGSETVIQALFDQLQRMPNVNIRTNTPVASIKLAGDQVESIILAGNAEVISCRNVISTIDLKALARLLRTSKHEYLEQILQIEYLGVVCGLLKLCQPVTNSYWINVNDSEIPFNGFIEYSNLNQHLGIDNHSIVYIPYYLSPSAARYSYDDQTLLTEFIDGLNRINPAINEKCVEGFQISRARSAQAICSVGFLEKVPQHETPIAGLFITDSAQYYPEDRTISAAIRLGRKVARIFDQRKVYV